MALQTKVFSTGDYGWKSWSNGYVITLTLTEESISVADNSSLVSYLFTISNTDNNRFSSDDYSWGISVGGQSIAINHFNFNLTANHTTQTIAAGQVTVAHNSDGTLDMPYSVSVPNVQNWTSYGPPAMTLSGTWPLTGIPRRASLLTVSNFTDEGNPTITYSNPAGTVADSLQAAVLDETKTVVYVPYRELSKTATTYTFSLSEAERNTLRNAMPDRKSMTVFVHLWSNVGGLQDGQYLPAVFSVVNADPALSPAVQDSNSATVALTGDSSVLVRYHSSASFSTGAEAIKGASLVSQKAVCGGRHIAAASGVFANVDSGMLVFTATDSRGNSASVTVDKAAQGKLVPYIRLTCDLAHTQPDTDGNMTVRASGNYYKGSFGKASNTLTVQYRYKVSGEAWLDTEEEWHTMTPVPGTGHYTAESALTGLNYQSAYTFQTRAADSLETVLSEEYTARATPIFDWGEHDFNINGTLKINNYPVDFPVEQGKISGWIYRKWESGMAECWTAVAIGPTFSVYKTVDISLPFAFIDDDAFINATCYQCPCPMRFKDLYVANSNYSPYLHLTVHPTDDILESGEVQWSTAVNIHIIGRWKQGGLQWES